jgi:lysophospholipase L1-like esterase
MSMIRLLILLLPCLVMAQAKPHKLKTFQSKTSTSSALLRVACLGDSNTAGGQGGTSWPTLLGTKLGTTKAYVKNFGISGDTAANMVNRWRADIMEEKFHVLVLLIGTNDLTSGATGATVSTYMETIANEAMSKGLRVVILYLLPRRTDTSPGGCGTGVWSSTIQTNLLDANTRFQTYCSNTNTTCIDTYTLTGDGSGREEYLKASYRSDCIHLNAVGYDVVATAVQTVLQ